MSVLLPINGTDRWTDEQTDTVLSLECLLLEMLSVSDTRIPNLSLNYEAIKEIKNLHLSTTNTEAIRTCCTYAVCPLRTNVA